MNQKFLGMTMACVVLSGCVSTSAPSASGNGTLTPTPANPVVASLNSRLAEQQEHAQERLALMQKIQDLDKELSEIKSRSYGKAAMPATPPSSVIATTSPVVQLAIPNAAKRNRGKKGKAPIELDSVNRETIVLQDTGMTFRVMHGFARTEFQPSTPFQTQLLDAARAGKRIEIRGRTDASVANDIDREIAMARALNARLFLAKNGIHPRKMRINYMAAGDHVADNTTADGRARNRRVEIETTGITPDVLEDMAAVIRQDLQ